MRVVDKGCFELSSRCKSLIVDSKSSRVAQIRGAHIFRDLFKISPNQRSVLSVGVDEIAVCEAVEIDRSVPKSFSQESER